MEKGSSQGFPLIGIIAGAAVGILLANLFLSVIGAAIGGVVAVVLDGSISIKRAVGIGIAAGVVVGVFQAYLVGVLLPEYYSANAQLLGSAAGNAPLLSAVIELVQAATVVIYAASCTVGSVIGKFLFVKSMDVGRWIGCAGKIRRGRWPD